MLRRWRLVTMCVLVALHSFFGLALWAAEPAPTENAPATTAVYVRMTKPDQPEPPAVIRVEPISDALRSDYELDPFYKKVAVIDNIPIIGSENVSDYALLECAWIVDHMLDGLDKIKQALVENKVRIGIIAATEFTMDIPENQRPWMIARAAYNDRRSRGLGGLTYTTCGEENLLSLRGDPYRRENITIHEFSHTIASNLRRVDRDWWDRLSDLYRQAMDEGLWANSYAATNVQEYWAEGTQSWFDCNTPNDDGRVHNGIWNREKLKKYDPRLAQFLTETFGDGQWRYSKTTARPDDQVAHLVGLDRDQLPTFSFNNSPRIQAENAAGGPRRSRRRRDSGRREGNRNTVDNSSDRSGDSTADAAPPTEKDDADSGEAAVAEKNETPAQGD